MRKLISGTMLAAAASAVAAPLTVEDYCDVKLTAPASVKEMTPMPDGESYAAISDDGKSIEIFSFKTGEKTGVLFSIDDVKGSVRIEDFDGYEISDNGMTLLLWNESEKIYRHSFRAEYYVYDIRRHTMKRVSEGGPQRAATLSHDGKKVAYERDNNLFVSNLEYGNDIAITTDGTPNGVIYGSPDWGYEEEFGVLNTIRWNGDDTMLAYMRFDESEVPMYHFDAYRSFCDDEPLGDPYPAQYAYKYSLAGYPASKVSVLAYNLDTRTSRKMDIPMAENDYIPHLEFDGSGRQLMVATLNHDQNHLKLYRVNPASTVARLLFEEKSRGWISPMILSMNRYEADWFVFASERSGYCHLYRYNYDGVLQAQLTKGEFNVTDYYGYDRKRGIHYLQTTSLGAVNRNVASLNSKGALTLLTGKPGWETALWSGNFNYWLRDWSDVSTPDIYSLMNASGATLVTVEDNAAYRSKYASAPKKELVKVKNDAGEEMNGYIIKPSDFDASKQYPLVMYQYNGPDSQEVRNRWSMEGVYYLCSEGYVIGCVDGRGTGYRSRDWAYAVYKDLGNIEAADQIAGARWFGSLPYVDAGRMACFGWSYGGYMTLMELQKENSPFKCGVSMAPVTDWRFYDNIYTERFMLTPAQNENGYDRASAIDKTSMLNVPLLIMSGTNDDNVHFYNTLKYTSKLTSEGKLFDMMAYTGFEHSLRMCNARTMLFRKISQFLKGNL